MRRWNGWGDDTIDYPLPDKGFALLTDWVGPSNPPQDVPLAAVLESVSASRLPEHPLIQTDEEIRVRHARGQSLPDMVSMRTCTLTVPDGVAIPTTVEAVESLIHLAQANQFSLIPYGGGTSVVGHVNPPADDIPSLTVNLQRLNGFRQLDKTSHLATFGAGIQGPDLEAQLRAKGFTLGHFPPIF